MTGHGTAPELHHVWVRARGGSTAPQQWIGFLHGILGMGANWKSIAQQVVDRLPSWGALLVDLRMHGRSQGFAPPHSVQAAAEDLRRFAPAPNGRMVSAWCAHSFSSKVAALFAQISTRSVQHLFWVDANPCELVVRREDAARVRSPDRVERVLGALERLPASFGSRGEFLTALSDHGIESATRAWLGMNLRNTGERWCWGLDLRAIRQLLEDYRIIDAWPLLESLAARTRIYFLMGGRSPVLDGSNRARMERLARERPRQFAFEVEPTAGHWLHVDAPDWTVATICRYLARE